MNYYTVRKIVFTSLFLMGFLTCSFVYITPCTIGVRTPVKFDSTEYIFTGKVRGYIGPFTSTEFDTKYMGLEVEIIDAIYLPQKPQRYFEIIDYSLGPACDISPIQDEELRRRYPVGTIIRVITKRTGMIKTDIAPGNIRLDLDPFVNPHISVDYPDIPALHSSKDFYFDYRLMSQDSLISIERQKLGSKFPDKNSLSGLFLTLGEFELRKDLYRLSRAMTTDEKLSILKRLADYPSYWQTQGKQLAEKYISDKDTQLSVIHLFKSQRYIAPIDTTLHADLPSSLRSSWKHCDAPDGGDVSSFQIMQRKDSVCLFVLTKNYQFWRSYDKGKSWQELHPEVLRKRVYTLSVIENCIFAIPDSGIFRSTDDGNSWQRSQVPQTSEERQRVNLYGSGFGCFFADLNGNTLLRSTDKGLTWDSVQINLERQYIHFLYISNSHLFIQTDKGIFVSMDAGISWKKADSGLPLHVYSRLRKRVIWITAFTENAGRFFARAEEGMFTVDSSLSNWQKSQFNVGRYGAFSIAGGKNGLYIAAADSFFRSLDNGINWTPIGPVPFKQCNALYVNGSEIFAHTTRGLFSSPDRGEHWRDLSIGLHNANINHLVLHGNEIFAFTDEKQIFRSPDDCRHWYPVKEVPNQQWSNAYASDDQFLFLQTYWELYRYSDNDSSWERTCAHKNISASLISGKVILLLTNDSLFRSTDSGEHWAGSKMEGISYLISVPDSFIFAFGRKTMRSKDAGITWDTVKLQNLGRSPVFFKKKNYLRMLIASPENLMESHDGGTSWDVIKDTVWYNFVHMVQKDNCLFATNGRTGVYISINEGDNWIPLNYGLGNLRVNDLLIKGKKLFIANPSGVWVHEIE
jgi:photosystem II stability/assembly factor-like uncharacterized protein